MARDNFKGFSGSPELRSPLFQRFDYGEQLLVVNFVVALGGRLLRITLPGVGIPPSRCDRTSHDTQSEASVSNAVKSYMARTVWARRS